MFRLRLQPIAFRRVATLVSALLFMCLASSARSYGEDRYFAGLITGGIATNWHDPYNWSDGIVPGAADTAWIVHFDEWDRDIVPSGPVSVGTLELGNGGAGLTTFYQSHDLSAQLEVLGLGSISLPTLHYVPQAHAMHVQNGGISTIGELRFGDYNSYQMSSAGTYVLNAGTLNAGVIILGEWGHGTFEQNGGVVTTDGLELSSTPSAKGTYTLAAGTLITAYSEIIGYAGDGTFMQLGGYHYIQDRLRLGTSGASIGRTTGTYILSGDDSVLSVNTEDIAKHMPGHFVQSGGTHEVRQVATVAYDHRGVFDLSGGALNVGNRLRIGFIGDGTFNHSGGAVTVGSPSMPGVMSTADDIGWGVYNLTGSSASVTVWGDEYVGRNSWGQFRQSAGSHFVSDTLHVVGYSSYTLEGGSLTVGGAMQIGWYGKGTFLQTGGTLTAETLNVSPGGRFTCAGGEVCIDTLGVDGPFIMAEGAGVTLRVNQLNVADRAARLDLTDNAMIIDYAGATPGAALSDLQTDLRTRAVYSSVGGPTHRLGYADNNVLRRSSFAGQPFPAGDFSQLLVGYTLGGDANLDGTVTRADLEMLAAGWQSVGPWTSGDFDYDGLVTQTDLQLLAWNWQDASDLQQALAALGLPNVVPEPSMIAEIGLAAMVVRRLRRSA